MKEDYEKLIEQAAREVGRYESLPPRAVPALRSLTLHSTAGIRAARKCNAEAASESFKEAVEYSSQLKDCVGESLYGSKLSEYDYKAFILFLRVVDAIVRHAAQGIVEELGTKCSCVPATQK